MDVAGREQHSTAAPLLCAAALPFRATPNATERRASAANSNRETASSIASLNRPHFINIHFSNSEPAAPHPIPGTLTSAGGQTLRGNKRILVGHRFSDDIKPGKSKRLQPLKLPPSQFSRHAFSPAKSIRDEVAHLSSWFTRAMSSPRSFATHQLLLTTHASKFRGPRNAPRFGVATRNSQSSRNPRKPQKTNNRTRLYPERPGACIFSPAFRSGEIKPGRKIRLPFGFGGPTIRVSAVGKSAKRRGGDRASGTNGWSSSLSLTEGGLP
jgi:hypothetical protein